MVVQLTVIGIVRLLWGESAKFIVDVWGTMVVQVERTIPNPYCIALPAWVTGMLSGASS